MFLNSRQHLNLFLEKCRAFKGLNLQVEWVEEEDEVFALVVLQADLLELAINHSCAIPVWCRSGN